jgi:tetratricopeptide (TPR) repeat protein
VRAIALESLGRTEEARADLERSLDIAPGDAMVLMRLARLLMRKGDLDEADRAIARAIAADPSSAEARRGRARVLLLRGSEADAAAELEEALRLEPGMMLALSDLAWVRAMARDERVRDPKTAVELAERAVSASGRESAGLLDPLAAAYAGVGRFDDAVATAGRAQVAARDAGDPDLAARIGKRLAAYRAGTIDRETPR